MIEVRIKLNSLNKPTSPNQKMHYMTVHVRNNRLARAIKHAFLEARNDLQAREMLQATQGSLSIKICYVRPRMLDTDNLVACLKHTRDVIANILIPDKAAGQADGDKRLHWEYLQKKGEIREYAFEITICEEK